MWHSRHVRDFGYRTVMSIQNRWGNWSGESLQKLKLKSMDGGLRIAVHLQDPLHFVQLTMAISIERNLHIRYVQLLKVSFCRLFGTIPANEFRFLCTTDQCVELASLLALG